MGCRGSVTLIKAVPKWIVASLGSKAGRDAALADVAYYLEVLREDLAEAVVVMMPGANVERGSTVLDVDRGIRAARLAAWSVTSA